MNHDENDISAKKETEIQSSWFSEKNEYFERSQGFVQKKSEGSQASERLRNVQFLDE